MYSRGKNIAKLVAGLNHLSCQLKVGDILITANRDAYNGIEFNRKLGTFKKVLERFTSKGMWIVTRSDSNRIHCHIAAEMSSMCTNFDWVSFEESEKYYKLYRKYRYKADLKFYRYFTVKYRRSLPKDWQHINHRLMSAGKRLGLGRVFLIPIRKNLKAYKWYLVSNVPYKRDRRDKGVHFFQSWGIGKTGKFQLSNSYTRSYRERLKKFAQGLQLTSNSYNISLRSVLGLSWYFKIKDLVRDIDSLSRDQQERYENLKSALRIHLLRSS